MAIKKARFIVEVEFDEEEVSIGNFLHNLQTSKWLGHFNTDIKFDGWIEEKICSLCGQPMLSSPACIKS